MNKKTNCFIYSIVLWVWQKNNIKTKNIRHMQPIMQLPYKHYFKVSNKKLEELYFSLILPQEQDR